MKVMDIARVMEELAPARLAEDGDKIGLQVGDPAAEVRTLTLTLSPSAAALAHAIKHRAQMVISHHPLIFRPLAGLTNSTPAERIVSGLVRAGISLFAAHTNYDSAPGGVNDVLAGLLGIRNVQPLMQAATRLRKVVVFVPNDHLEKVSAAICNAGAGRLGAYRDCTFRSEGIGTFTPLEGARPFIGKRGKTERVAEVRLESIVPEECVDGVVSAIRRAHPYEEPAFDVFALETPRGEHGLGRWGELAKPVPLRRFASTVRRKLGAPGVRYVGDGDRSIRKVAVCGGAGGDFYMHALRHGCDLFVTGDVKYHVFIEAQQLGLAVIDAGHGHTELPGVRALQPRLAGLLPGVKVLLGEAEDKMIRTA